ncbi:ell-associated factor Eaf [Onthophagus taurus]|uniref:ell-associated factor Eaf n=1 Tax=Onthophagus taurus TaxID=166361 RepID=UPI000C20F0D5|nr:ell-associated factor Eaf [Onthophagus taurus]
MADKFGFGSEIREIKIGQSFLDNNSTAFHTIRYDFKPASVDVNKIATVDVANNSQVTVTVPHLDGAGTQQTVFKGSQKTCQKECVLIIDKVTGDIRLESLNSNIILKKTRSVSTKPPIQDRSEKNALSSLNVPKAQTSPVGRRNSSKTKVTSGGRRAERNITQLIPKHSPLQSSPNYPSPKRDNHHGTHTDNNPNALASLPMIGLDEDFTEVAPAPPINNGINSMTTINRAEKSPILNNNSDNEANGVGEMSDSSSSSNSSDSESDNDNDVTIVHNPHLNSIGSGGGGVHTTNGGFNTNLVSTHDLKDDLCLSDTGSSDSE